VRRVVLLGLLAAVAAVGAGCGSHRTVVEVPPMTTSPYNGYAIQPPVKAPSFSLTDQSGRKVGAQDDRGHWLVVTFMYTNCPDVCPLIADNLRAAMSRLPDLRAIAISVDPVHDTKAAVRRFLADHRMPPAFRYVTGTEAQLRPVWAKYNVAATQGPKATISHSSYEVLVDPQGRERVLYDASMKAVDLIKGVHALQ
jgi:protein SCO1/2